MRRPIVFITFILCVSILIVDMIRPPVSDMLTQNRGNTVSVSGTVVKQVAKSDYTVFYLNNVFVENRKYNRKVRVNVYSEYDNLLYHKISIRGEVSLPEGRRNPGCFDYAGYLKSINVFAILSCNVISDIERPTGYFNMVYLLKKHTCDFLEEKLNEEQYSVVMGLTFADTSFMDEALIEIFRKGGTAHLLAVSGLHIGCLYAFLSRFKRKKRSPVSDIAIAAIMITYAAMTGFSASVVRAELMIFTRIFSGYLEERYDFLSSICVSVILILLVSPMQIYNGGFQMTYIAVFTIAIMLPVISEKIESKAASIITVQLGMIPYTAYVYNYVSATALISNIPVLFLAGILIPAGILTIPLSFVPAAGTLAAEFLGNLCDILVICNEFTYMKGMFTFNSVSPPLFLLLLYYGMMLILFSEWGRIYRGRKEFKKIAAAFTAAVVIAASFSLVCDDGFGNDDIVFIDVGQGDCLHIRSKKNILIDGGGSVGYNVGEKTLKPYLLKNGVRKIDIAFVTHLHSDHYKGLCELSQGYTIDTVAVYDGNREKEKQIRSEIKCRNIIYLKKGDTVNVDRNLSVEVIAPESRPVTDSDNENDNSLVLKAVYKGVRILMTADIDTEGEKKLQGDYTCDILKAAHHGSAYGSCEMFLDRASPKVAVISVGKNNYGHPAQQTLDRLDSRGIPCFRTDECGAVGIEAEKLKVDKIID